MTAGKKTKGKAASKKATSYVHDIVSNADESDYTQRATKNDPPGGVTPSSSRMFTRTSTFNGGSCTAVQTIACGETSNVQAIAISGVGWSVHSASATAGLYLSKLQEIKFH